MLAKKCLFVGIITVLSVSLAIADPPAVHPVTGEDLVIDCLRGTPDAIDGDLSDWNLEAMTPAVLDVVEQLFSGQDSWTGPEDCSGEFYLLWDDVNIYIAVVVKDDVLSMNKTDGNIWNADAIEVLFSTLNAVPPHDEHYQYGFNATNQRWNWCNMDGSGNREPDYLQISSSATADGYICEASIEYGQMPSLDFSEGNIIGFHPVFDDTDNGDRELQMTWTGREAHDQSLGFGHMILSADSVPAPAEQTVLFAEDFEGLALGPNVDEELAGDAVWTDTPPEGWSVDESGIPGIGMDATDGITEWAGWAFADKAWWIETAGDQDRSLFTLGSGTVAVADPDEWDDGERLPIPIAVDPYDTWLTTPEIKIASAEAGTLELKFDSSWRPEFDDNYHQTASITASFDGGDLVEVLLWESDEASANYKPYATNETVIVKLDNPEGAKKLVLTFGLYDAGNDWWWAIDNLEVSGIVLDMDPVDPGTDGLLAFYALDGDANDISGNGNDGIIHNVDTGGLGDGGSVWVDDPVFGTVISFNGTAEGAFVRAGEIPQMTLTNDFTWSFWAKQNAENTADNDIILGNRMDENAVDFVPRQFIKFTPTKFEWHMNGNGDDNLDYDDIPADVWLHHTVVKAADQLTYYRNGIEASSGTFTQPLDFPQPLFFGGDNEGSEGENWSGSMSDVGIYDRALSEAEVRYLAGQRAVPVDPGSSGLLALWTCDEGEGAVVGDVSGNGRDGMFVNGDSAWIEGVQGSAVELVGPTLIETPPLDMELTEVTMAGWIKPYGPQPDWSSIIMQRDPGLATGFNILGYQLAYHWNDTSDSWNFRGGDMIAEDDWTFAAVTIDPDKATFYVNGEAGSVNEVSHGPCLWDSNVYLGGDGTAGWVSRRMIGALDDVVIYDRALSTGEIRYLAGKRLMDDLLGPDITGLGDVVQGVPNDGDWPGAETPDLAIDDDVTTKYLHFKGDFEPDPGTGGSGLQITPLSGANIVTGLTLTTANDVPGRDPITFELSGSNDSIDGPYELIASGDIVDFAQEEEWPRFTMNATPITFDNNVAYTHYQLIFTAIRGPVGGSVNSMQIAEVELRVSKY
ncbi:LamG-like jellyroll fold domain-containing protein [Planctomycetota bacterium]